MGVGEALQGNFGTGGQLKLVYIYIYIYKDYRLNPAK
jgi:hypothetical protein